MIRILLEKPVRFARGLVSFIVETLEARQKLARTNDFTIGLNRAEIRLHQQIRAGKPPVLGAAWDH